MNLPWSGEVVGIGEGKGNRFRRGNKCILARGVRVYHARKKEVFLAEVPKEH